MTTRIIETEQDRISVISLVKQRSFPFTVNILKGKKRSNNQNKTQRMWINEAAEQLQDQTPEEYRGYCKLHFGVPILRAKDEIFCEKYDRIIRPLTYEQKLECMMVPLDFPVTRLMTSYHKSQYLDTIWHHFTSLGVVLTEPKRG